MAVTAVPGAGKTFTLSHLAARLVERHTEVGKTLLEGLGLDATVIEIVHAHHERFDGSGYPDGVAGEEIHPAARILAIADTLEAMTVPRPYRAALTYDDVVEEISRRNAAKFDPRLIRAFVAVPSDDWDAIREAVATLVARVPERARVEATVEESGSSLQRHGGGAR